MTKLSERFIWKELINHSAFHLRVGMVNNRDTGTRLKNGRDSESRYRPFVEYNINVIVHVFEDCIANRVPSFVFTTVDNYSCNSEYISRTFDPYLCLNLRTSPGSSMESYMSHNLHPFTNISL